MRKINLTTLFIATILIYVTFHVTEEACGNFPLFMHENWGIPDIGYARWLLHNMLLFLPVLVAGLFVYSFDEARLLAFGAGISLWGVLNFFEHLFYTIKNGAVSPGFFSSFLFVAVAIAVAVKLKSIGRLNIKTIALSFLCCVVYWIVPVLLIVTFGSKLARIVD